MQTVPCTIEILDVHSLHIHINIVYWYMTESCSTTFASGIEVRFSRRNLGQRVRSSRKEKSSWSTCEDHWLRSEDQLEATKLSNNNEAIFFSNFKCREVKYLAELVLNDQPIPQPSVLQEERRHMSD